MPIEYEEILPCPFCGRNGDLMWSDTRTRFKYSVMCNDHCLAEGPIANTAEEAIEKWNGRYRSLPTTKTEG